MQVRSQNELARLLGISKATVSQHAKNGMPTDSVEAAQAWRRKHLSIARRKPAAAPAGDRLVSRASAMQNAAQADLEAGGDIALLIPTLRAALAAVPLSDRGGVHLAQDVMSLLLAPLLDQLPHRKDNPTASCGAPVYSDVMSDTDAHLAGEFLYRVAAGEIVFPNGVTL